MLTNKLIERPIITLEDFLEHFKIDKSFNLKKRISLNFEFDLRPQTDKIAPIIKLAKPEDAKIIVDLFIKTYDGMYPYREVQIVEEMRKMIQDPSYHWFLFTLEPDIIIGCFGVHLEFEKKRAFYFGFIIKKIYQGVIDTIRAFACSLNVLSRIFKKEILVWYSETRTAHNSAQFIETLCGVMPIAFFPNKDIFFNRIESDFMHIIYNEKVLKENRCKDVPKIIRQILNYYAYSNSLYHLGNPIVENPEIKFNSEELKDLKERLYIRTKIEKHFYYNIKILLKNSKSYFNFHYNIGNQSVEKAIYEVKNLEELYIFLQIVKNYIDKFNIRYFECFVSAYEPSHQKIFFNTGFKPAGYVPCWNYNKEKNEFEDHIIFNYFKGKIDWDFEVIPETLTLLKTLKIKTFEEYLIQNTSQSRI